MREKILSLLSTFEKGEKDDGKEFLSSVLFNENGQIRPWIIQAFESLLSSVCQLSPEKESSFRNLMFEDSSTRNGLSCSEIEEGFLLPKGHGSKVSTSQATQKQAKSVTEEETRKEDFLKLLRSSLEKGENVCSNQNILPLKGRSSLVIPADERRESLASFGDDGQIRPGLLHAFECFISSFCKPPLEGRSAMVSSAVAKVSNMDSSLVNIETKKEEVLMDFLQGCNETKGKEGEKKRSEVLIPMEDQARKEKLLKLIRHATSKGESVLYDAAFLEQCANILQLGNHEGTQPRIEFPTESKQVMVTGNVEELNGELSAEMEIDASSLCEHGRERDDYYGPADNSPPDKGDFAVSGAPHLPKQKEDCRVKKGGSSQAKKGHSSDSLGERARTFANIVKVGKKSSDCLSPSHVSQLAFSNFSPHHNVTCMGGKDKASPAVHNVPFHSLETKKPGHPSSNEAFATSQHAVSVKNKEKQKQDSGFPTSSKEETPLLKIDDETLNKRMSLCKYSIIGKISLAKGEEPWTVQKLRGKLEEIWKLHSAWRLIGLGKGFFQILLLSQEEWDKVWARGIIHLKPGTMRLQRWSINFDPLKEKTTNAQVWFRIFQLPWGL